MKTLDRIGWSVVGQVEKWDADELNLHRLLDQPSSEIRKAGIDPYEVVPFEGNLLLNEGIQEMWLLITGGAADAYSNANARLGVGNSSTAASATDTALLGASQLYKAMNATYPQLANQDATFQADFTDAEANFAWEEWSIDNGNTPNNNMNRKVVSLGSKASGTWTLTVTITLS